MLELAIVLVSCAAYHWLGRFDGDALMLRCGVRSTGINFWSLVHSAGMTVAALLVLALEERQDVVEPERSFACLPPSSILAWVLPPIELGYALHDLLDGLSMRRVDLIAHGVVVAAALVPMIALGVAHHTSRLLLMHLSTIFLNMRRADLGGAGNSAVDASFLVSFLLLRLGLLPLWWVRFLSHGARSDPAGWGGCMHYGVLYGAFASGLVMHGLNLHRGGCDHRPPWLPFPRRRTQAPGGSMSPGRFSYAPQSVEACRGLRTSRPRAPKLRCLHFASQPGTGRACCCARRTAGCVAARPSAPPTALEASRRRATRR